MAVMPTLYSDLVVDRTWRGQFLVPLLPLHPVLALWSMDEKVGKLDNRVEAEFKIALAKYYRSFRHYVYLKCEIRCQLVKGDYISRLWTLLVFFILNGMAKRKLAILSFLCCGEIVKKTLLMVGEIHWRCL